MEPDKEILKELQRFSFDEKIFHTNISFNALTYLIHRAVGNILAVHLKDFLPVQEEKKAKLFSIEEAAEFFGVSMVTIHAWKKQGILQGFKRIGGRVYILESDCLESMKEIKLKKK